MKKIGKKVFLRSGNFLGTIVLNYSDLSQEDQYKYLRLGDVKESFLVAIHGNNGWKMSSWFDNSNKLMVNLIKKYFKDFKKIDFENQRFWFYTNFEMKSFKIKSNLLDNE